MSLSRLHNLLAGGTPLMSPFLMLGDPDPGTSLALALAAIDAGVQVLELGLPYSDPCADGPVVQQACVRARAAGVSTAEAIEILGGIHAARPHVPLNLLVYGNLVHAWGAERFVTAAAAHGASSLLVPDLPLEEAGDLRRQCAAHDVGWVPLLATITPPARVAALCAAATGFAYVTAIQGVTGGAPGRAPRNVMGQALASERIPLCVGFGLSQPSHVRDAFDSGASLAVVGSHLLRSIGDGVAAGRGGEALVADFVHALHPFLISED